MLPLLRHARPDSPRTDLSSRPLCCSSAHQLAARRLFDAVRMCVGFISMLRQNQSVGFLQPDLAQRVAQHCVSPPPELHHQDVLHRHIDGVVMDERQVLRIYQHLKYIVCCQSDCDTRTQIKVVLQEAELLYVLL